MNDSQQRKSGAILSYVSIILTTLVQLLYTPLLISKLGQSEYGLYSLIYSIIGYLTVLDLGFGNAIVVYTAKYRAQKKYDEEKKLHGMFFVIFCVIGVVASLLGIILYFNVNNLFGNTMTSIELSKAKIMMLILTVNIAITFIFNIYTSIITSYERFTFQKVMSILNTILKPIIMIPLLFLGYKSITMCLIVTLVNAFVLITNYIYCKKKLNIKIKFQGFDKALFKTIFGYSFFIFLAVIVDKINWNVDQFILGAVSGTVAVSIYSVATQINTLFINLSTVVSGVMLPKMSKMIAEEATSQELTNEMIKVGRLQFYIIFLMASGLILVGKQFITSWAGIEYEESFYVALLLILPLCIPLLQNLGISIRQAMNKHKFAAFVNIGTALLNLVVSMFLAKHYGATGAAIGTAVGTLVSSLIINVYYHVSLKLNMLKFWKVIIKLLLPCVIPLGISVFIISLTDISGFMGVIIYAGIYSILYAITMYLFSMNTYEKDLIKKVLNKITRR